MWPEFAEQNKGEESCTKSNPEMTGVCPLSTRLSTDQCMLVGKPTEAGERTTAKC